MKESHEHKVIKKWIQNFNKKLHKKLVWKNNVRMNILKDSNMNDLSQYHLTNYRSWGDINRFEIA